MSNGSGSNLACQRMSESSSGGRLPLINGIVHVLKSGGRWCDCPPEYGLRQRSIRVQSEANTIQDMSNACVPPPRHTDKEKALSLSVLLKPILVLLPRMH